MKLHIKPIGGEFWSDKIIFNNKADNFKNLNATFLSGGQSAIQFIIENIRFKDDEYILVPAYLCPTILYNFKNKNIRFVFYEINEDLSIDLESIKSKIDGYKVRALFFIDYFGFYHNQETIDFLIEVKKRGIVLIEDAVQMFWFSKMNKFIGDYIFNSYRKFLPIDGSIVLSNECGKVPSSKDNYYKLIKKARLKKTKYIKFNIGTEEEFLKLFDEANKAYYIREEVIGMDNEDKRLLNKVNYKLIKERRINNYKYLYDNIEENDNVKILFNKKLLTDNVPLGFPILISNRDFIRSTLKKHSIYCPVHWDLREEEWTNNFEKSKMISNRILTIPIDWRYDKNDMDYLISKFTFM